MLIYKYLNSIGPKYFANFLNLRDVYYNVRDKGSNLVQPPFNTEWMQKSFPFITCKQWNKLMLYTGNSDKLQVFIKALHKFNLES